MIKALTRAGVLLPPFLFFGLSGQLPADDFQQEASRQEHVQVTATRRAEDEFDVSAATNIVGQSDIEDQNPDVLAEVLRGLPGLWFQQTTPGQGIPIIRGLKGSQVLHLVDGMRLNNAFFRDAPNQYLGLVDPLLSRSVEVVRGASGSLYGSDAMGGVVNIITSSLPVGRGEHFNESRLYGAFDSADSGLTGRVQTTAVRGNTGITIGTTYQERNDRKTGSGTTLKPSGFRSRAADAKLAHRFDDRSELTFTLQLLEQPSTPRVDELTAGFGQAEAASSEFYFEPNERHYAHLRYQYEDGGWFDRLTFNAARQRIQDDRRSRDNGSTLRNTEQNRSTLDGLTLQIDHDLQSGPFLTWGLELYQDEVRSARQRTDISSGVSEVVSSRFPNGSTLDSTAAYISADWKRDEQFDISAGLRYSRFDIGLAPTPVSNAANLSPEDVTGDLHLAWYLSDVTHLVANFGRGFRAPNIFDLGTLGPRPGNRFNIANPNLGPESVWNFDFGIKHRQGRFELEAYAFYLDYEDKITSVLTGETTDTGRIVVRAENLNDVTLYGIEAGLRWMPGDRLSLDATLNLTRGTERDSSDIKQDADRIPPLNGRIALSYQFTERIEFESALLFAARQDRLSSRDARDPRINPLGSAGWGTLSLAVRWRPSDTLRLGVNLENLGDKGYREHASGIDAPGRNVSLFISRTF